MRGEKRISGMLALCLCLVGCSAMPPAAAGPATEEPAGQTTAVSIISEARRTTEAPEELLLVLPAEESADSKNYDITYSEESPAYTRQEKDKALIADAPAKESLFEGETDELTPDDKAKKRIIEAVTDRTRALQQEEGFSEDTEVYYCVTYNSDALLSMLIEIKQADDITVWPVTYSWITGEECDLADFFIDTQSGWRGLLADLVSDAADANGITLLCEVPPVRDDQLFYITNNGGIVLLYRPYEITTYQAGFPCFILPMERLSLYLSGRYGIDGDAEEEG